MKNSEIKKKEVMNQIQWIAYAYTRGDNILNLLLAPNFDVPDAIFQISPPDDKNFPSLQRCKFEAVSGWVLDVLLQTCNDLPGNNAADCYHRVSSVPQAGLLRGLLFERQVLNYLSHIQAEREFQIHRLTDSTQMTWTYSGPIQRITIQESTIFYEITEAVRNRRPLHLVPLFRIFEAVDSVLYDPNDPNAVLTCIQVTMNEKDHAIPVSDLQHIQSWLKPRTLLEGLRVEKGRPWRFIFVVPKGMESTFKLQNSDGDTATSEWARKVDQYVLGLNEGTIFKRRSDSSGQQVQR